MDVGSALAVEAKDGLSGGVTDLELNGCGERDDIFDRRLREAVMTEHLDGGRNDSLGPSILETEWTDVSGGTDAFRQKRSKRNK